MYDILNTIAGQIPTYAASFASDISPLIVLPLGFALFAGVATWVKRFFAG